MRLGAGAGVGAAAGAAALVLAAASPIALAHQSVVHVFGDDGGFLTGLTQHLTHLSYPLAAFVLGLLAGQRGPDALAWTLAAWPAGLVGGVLLLTGDCPAAAFELVSGATIALLGLLVALAVPLPPVTVPSIGLLSGVALGAAGCLVMPLDAAPILFALGFAAGGQLIAALAALPALAANRVPWQYVAVRAVGSWIAAIGLLVLALGASVADASIELSGRAVANR
jgi:hydrogenase/urease accessory protein HupE